MTVNSGRWAARFAGSFSGRNMLRANRLCQANSLTTRIGSRYFGIGAAPGVEDEQVLVLERRPSCRGAASSNLASSIGLLTVPQWTCCSLCGSRTTNLSFGERPVCCPVRATSGPSAARWPFAAAQGLLVKAAGLRFQWTRPGADNAKSLEPVRPLNLYGHLCLTPRVAAVVAVRGGKPNDGRGIVSSDESADRTV